MFQNHAIYAVSALGDQKAPYIPILLSQKAPKTRYLRAFFARCAKNHGIYSVPQCRFVTAGANLQRSATGYVYIFRMVAIQQCMNCLIGSSGTTTT